MFSEISKPIYSKEVDEKVQMAKSYAKRHGIKTYTVEIHLWQDGDSQVELFYNADGYRISILIK